MSTSDPRIHCPTCRKRFRVPADHLPSAGGEASVRCRACGETFAVRRDDEGAVEVIGGGAPPAAKTPREGGRRGGGRRSRTSRRASAPVRRAARPAGEGTLLAEGARVGRYEIEALLGRGGMGAVYRAFDPAANRHVALKLLPGSAPEADRRRFQREVEVQGNVQHPAIMPIFDSGALGSSRFFTMELLREPMRLGDLAELARSGQASKDPRLRPVATLEGIIRHVVLPVCRAIHHANANVGVLHRDLKPDNVLIDRVGLRPFVIDFGVCSLLEKKNPRLAHLPPELPERLEGGRVRVTGTLMYMPPEQARGEVDRRGDVWGLGAILHALLTGASPLEPARERIVPTEARMEGLRMLIQQARREGNDAELAEFTRKLQEVARGEERSVEDLQRDVLAARYLPRPPWVPAPLEAIVARALAARPRDRYRHALALHDDLRAWLEGRPVRALLARRGPLRRMAYRGRVLVARHKALAAVGVLLLVGAIAVVAALGARRTRPAGPDAAALLAQAQAALEAGETDEARRLARRALVADEDLQAAEALLARIGRREQIARAIARGETLEAAAQGAFVRGDEALGRRRLAALGALVDEVLAPALEGEDDAAAEAARARWAGLARGERAVRVQIPGGEAPVTAMPVAPGAGPVAWAEARLLETDAQGVARLVPGAWVLLAERGGGTVSWPVRVAWGREVLDIACPADPATVPSDGVLVPGGPAPAPYDGDVVPSLVWDRTEVTMAEYGRFLASLPVAERARRVPREAGVLGLPDRPLWASDGAGGFEVPAGGARRAVEGVSALDAAACARFLGRQLPTAAAWARAAGGEDGRLLVTGDLPALLAAGARLDTPGLGPGDVLACDADRSVWGVRDLAAGVAEHTATTATLHGRHGHVVMGGGYLTSPARAFTTEGRTVAGFVPAAGVGFRCVRPYEPGPGRGPVPETPGDGPR